MTTRDRVATLRERVRARSEQRAGERRVRSPQRADHPTLLDQVLSSSLEPDYEFVAQRRAAGEGTPPPERPGRARRRWATAVVLVLFALLIVAAGRENREDSPADALVRETLVTTASERRQELADLQGAVEEGRRATSALGERAAAAAATRDGAVARLRRAASAAGFLGLEGPGLRMELTDAPGGVELVQSNDLALLVDGLWEAGAEAIAVSGQRLTARSAITSTGESVNVNRRPLTPPYVVSVIGDPQRLEARLAETQGGQAWLLLVAELGFGYDVEQRDSLTLPPARDLLLSTCGPCFPSLDAEPSGQQEEGAG